MTLQVQFQDAVALHQQGKLVEAEALYCRIMAEMPDNFAARYMFALMRYQQKRNDEALAAVEEALKRNRLSPDALALHGVLLQEAGRHEEGLASLDAAIAAKPDDAAFWFNRGRALLNMGRGDEALTAMEKSLALNPRNGEGWKISGALRQRLNRMTEALADFDKCLALQPADAETWFRRGATLYALRRQNEARESFTRALAIKPDHAEAMYQRGVAAWMGAMDFEAASADLEQALRLDASLAYAPGWLLMVRQYVADWSNFAADVARINDGIREGRKVTEPFVYQAISESPADLRSCSVIYAGDRYPARAAIAPKTATAGKIRIGYLSGEFRDQATAYLTAGLYECHDRERFDIVGFDNGWDDGSAIRKRLNASLGRIVDISLLSSRSAAEAVKAEGIDILVNLNGYFGEHRMDVFAQRPAPIQVNYLGFPATLGADYIDYLIADRIAIPEDERKYYAEQIVYLPDCYQVNDFWVKGQPAPPSRADCGLPESAFVFCNFNSSHKLTPEAFAGWMRILRQTPGSVLWLLEFHPRFAANLRKAAQAQGIDGARILFAPVVKHDFHLARLSLADLCLDALPYNAHTTGSDALRAGVPLLTRRGSAFAGRVGASLLNAVGLPELVTETEEEFEALAMCLAQEPARLAALRGKLRHNRAGAPLFDTARFTRNLEAAYTQMWERRDESPRGFSL